jgi:cytochrome c556
MENDTARRTGPGRPALLIDLGAQKKITGPVGLSEAHILWTVRLEYGPTIVFRPPYRESTFIDVPRYREIRSMIRKWMVFVLSTGILVSLGLGAGLSNAQDEKESELEKIMEQVQKNNVVITKGIRTPANFKKSQKDVEKSAKELVKLAKKAKPIKDALTKAKEEKDPGAKWTAFLDTMVKDTEKFEAVVAKPDATNVQAKDAFKSVAKTCTECHAIFRVDDEKF